jgi:hypothetical protein
MKLLKQYDCNKNVAPEKVMIVNAGFEKKVKEGRKSKYN